MMLNDLDFDFPGRRGAVGEEGDWDYDLHGLQEFTVPEIMDYDPPTRRVMVRTGSPGRPRHTVTLTISKTGEFCSALRQRYGLA